MQHKRPGRLELKRRRETALRNLESHTYAGSKAERNEVPETEWAARRNREMDTLHAHL